MKNDRPLTMAHLDMDGNALAKHGGDHVELHPGLDLWMRGARYGTIKKISVDGIATVKMDHPGIKKLQRIQTGRLKLTTNRNPRKRGRGRSAAQKAATARMLAANRRGKKGGGRKRRANPKGPPLTGFQIAALRQGKILFLSGIGLSDNRGAASLFGSLKAARHVAKQVRTAGRKLGVSKVAVVAKFDSAAEIGKFLGGA
jgi:hypothetical protein